MTKNISPVAASLNLQTKHTVEHSARMVNCLLQVVKVELYRCVGDSNGFSLSKDHC